MHVRSLLVVLMLVPLALAGCLDKGEADGAAVDAAAADGAAAPENRDPAAQAPPASSGSSSAERKEAAPTPASEESAAEGEATMPAPVDEPVLWNGKLGTSACVPAGPGSCVRPVGMGGDWYLFPQLGGAPLAAELTLTWSAAGPHDEKLTFLLLDVEGNQDSWSGIAIAVAEGPSPLTLSASEIAIEPGRHLVLAVRPASLVPQPLYAFVENGAAFQVDGFVTVQPAA